MTRRQVALWATIGTTVAGAAVGIVATTAGAEPGTAAHYPAGASATRFTGLAFDACDAPALSTMQAWRSSPFGAIGVYTSGKYRACDQKRLTDDWVEDVSAMGWKLIPIDVGLQAPCSDNRRLHPMSRTPSKAEKQGESAAENAMKAAGKLGILAGSALYSDIEQFDSRDSGCTEAVRSYLSGWTKKLHDGGYLAGAYGNLGSAVRSQAASYSSEAHARLDVVWSAQWDGDPTTEDWNGLLDEHWPAHQRIKQYRGDHDETHGGKRINIDSNIVDAPVATVTQRHQVAVAASSRAQPTGLAATVDPFAVAATASVVCWTNTPAGAWNKLADGSYLPGAATPTATSLVLPECTTPFQVIVDAATTRIGPSVDADEHGAIPGGGLVWTTCETPGVTLGQPGFWQRLDTGSWVSSPLTTKPNPYARHPAVPLCTIVPAVPGTAS